MFKFVTESGSTWTVHQGRITRKGGDYLGLPIVAEPFAWVETPEVGRMARLQIKSGDVPVSTGYVAYILVNGMLPDDHEDEILDALAGHP